MNRFQSLRCLVVLSLLSPLIAASLFAAERPNVVLIMTDNHGAWTLGCYGNHEIRTPHIDRLADEGTLFTQAYSSNPVCSPTRATFLTGLVPSQHGVHCFLVGGRLQVGPEARCTLDEFTSLPEILRDAGYSCGLVGKWHLGDNLHPQEGFDDYWITMPHGGTSTFYDAPVIEDGKVRKEPQYLTDFWTKHAVRFIEHSADRDKPFFLFLSYNGPYSLGRLLLREGRNRHAAFYADKELASFPRGPAHPWQYNNLDYQNNPVSIRRVATEVSGVDDGVGTVMAVLKQHGLDRNTIVVFVADQGWSGGHGGYFGMGDHTRPVTAHDAMMRIPMIWRFPGHIPAGVRSDRLVTNYDFLPTLLGQLQLGDKLPTSPKSPGKDFSDELTAQRPTQRSADDAVFYEFEGLRSIRTAAWKYVHRHPNGPHELYDLSADPEEFNNLASNEQHAAQREKLKGRIDAFYRQYSLPQYDMWHGGTSQARVFVGVDEEIAQADPVEPPPLAEGFHQPPIVVPEGFTVELAAGPPLTAHPNFATFDDRGRLFVSESAGVNLTAEELAAQLPNSVRLLEDTDGDGRFDKSTLFADKMTFPMGGAWHDGALYVASPPSIWRLEDTDGDGVADRRDELVNSFGYTGNAASIHGCIPGPDGRLYWCDGYHGHEFKDRAGNVVSKREGSYIFSCQPDGSDVRIFCGGGMDNPVEVDFIETGEMLGTVNIFRTRPRSDCLVHWLWGGAYPHRERVLTEIKVTGDLLGDVHDFGHVAVSGLLCYRSGVMDRRWRGNFFVTFFNSGKVVRVELQRDGSTYKAVQREFLSSPNRDFHPTDLAEDADGSLLLVDTGGWFYRGCPTSQFAKPDIPGAIYRIRRLGMTPQVDPRGNQIDWEKLSDNQLPRLLGDTRYAVRQRAVAECARRGEAIVPVLKQVVRSRDLLCRQNALWALTRIPGKAARAAVRPALDDRDTDVRQIACRGITARPDPEAVEKLLDLLQHDVAPVRREAATALGRIGEARAVPTLLKSLSRTDADRGESHAIVYALIEINDPTTTRKGLAESNADIRRGTLIAVDQMDAGNLTADDAVPLVASLDPALQRAAADVFARHADWSARSAEVIASLLEQPGAARQSAAVLRKLTAKSLTQDAVAALVGRVLSDPSTAAETRDLFLAAIADVGPLPLSAGWKTPLTNLLQSDDPATVEKAITAVAALQTDYFHDRLRQIGADSARPTLLRVAALEAALGKKGRLTDASLDLLLVLLGGGPNESLQGAQKIGTAGLTKRQLVRLAPKLTMAGPSQLQELVGPFSRSVDADVAKAFLQAMETAKSLTSLTVPQFSDIIKRYPRELLPEANELLERIRQEEEAKLTRLDRLLPLLATGDAVRGKDVFFAEKAKCATCHRVGEQGTKVGPDLTTIGANRATRDLLESIVFPSATIVRDYEPYSVITDSGKVLNGLIARETADTLYIQQQTGDPVAVPREEIEELAPATVSIMPNGLEQALTEAELADVIAFLASLK